jgi:hypothetical protein
MFDAIPRARSPVSDARWTAFGDLTFSATLFNVDERKFLVFDVRVERPRLLLPSLTSSASIRGCKVEAALRVEVP